MHTCAKAQLRLHSISSEPRLDSRLGMAFTQNRESDVA